MAIKDSGGTEGGGAQFIIGFLLSTLALYFFFDSVQVRGVGGGVFSHALGGGGRGMGMGQTTSMGILFVPFLIGVIGLFYDASKMWAWGLFWIGLAVLVIEMLSSLRFQFSMKSTALLMMFIMFGAGAGMMLRSYRPPANSKGNDPKTDQESADKSS